MGNDHEQAHDHPVRIAPLAQQEWSQAAVAAMSVLPPEMAPPPGAEINVLGVLAHHPDLAEAILTFSLYLRFRSTLSDRQRELAILRTALLRGAEYELLRHTRLARRYGFTDDELLAVADGSGAPGWSVEEALLLRAAEELCEAYRVSDATWVALTQHYSRQQIMDILFVVGTYDMYAMAYNSMGIQPEGNLPPFPTRPEN
jgi:4-carboxymuconolactone decarboxylase